MEKYSDGVFLENLHCIGSEVEGKDPCGSSDACSVYEKTELKTGKVVFDAFCRSCTQSFSIQQVANSSLGEILYEDGDKPKKRSNLVPKVRITREETIAVMKKADFKPNGYLGIEEEYFKFFGHRLEKDKEGDVVQEFYPETQGGHFYGFKTRFTLPNGKKCFGRVGFTGQQSDLSGQSLFKDVTGKYILITGGEKDKVAAYKMLKESQDRRYGEEAGFNYIPVVSPTTGESSAHVQIAKQYDFLNQFENIIIGMDNDDAGNEAVKKIIEVLPKEKVKVAKWSCKDPFEMLEKGKEAQFLRDFYDAKDAIPQQVKTSKDADDEMEEELLREVIPLPPFMSQLQKLMAGGIPLGYWVNFIATTGGGKCLGKDTPILMHDMSKKFVQDVKKGDLIMGDDGSSRTVLTTCTGRETLYKVSQVRGDDYVVNESHILSLRVGADFKPKGWYKGDIVDICVRDYLKLNDNARHILKGYTGDFKNLGEKNKVKDPYVLGLWLADGTSAAPNVTISNKDKELVEALKSYCDENNYNMEVYPSNYRDNCTTYSVSGGMRAWLNSLGVLNNKGIPKEYLLSSYEDRKELLSGILDGDGYLSKSIAYDLTLKEGKLPEDVILLARSLGFKVSWKKCTKSCQGGFTGDYIRIHIGGDNLKDLPLRLERKRGRDREDGRRASNTGVKLTKLEVGEYYGFEIDGNKRFCLGDATVTHNTTYVNEIIYFLIFNSPHKVGVLSLELNAGQYQTVLLSRHMGVKIMKIPSREEKLAFLRKPETMLARKELRETDIGEERYAVLDEREGDLELVKENILKMIKKFNCKVIVIDPIQDMFEGASLEAQAAFVRFLKNTLKDGIAIICVCHVTKGSTKTDKDGNIIRRKLTEADVAGLSNIVKSGGANVIFDRDKEEKDEILKNVTDVNMPKCRWTGDSGVSGKWYYEPDTHTAHDFETYIKEVRPDWEHYLEEKQVSGKPKTTFKLPNKAEEVFEDTESLFG